MPEWLIIALGIVVAAIAIWWSRKFSLGSVIDFGREQGWEMLIVDSRVGLGDGDDSAYNVRFRDRDGLLIEGVIAGSGSGYRLVKFAKVPKKVEKAMFDVSLAMDCRRCGNSIPGGHRTCPYCSRTRDELQVD